MKLRLLIVMAAGLAVSACGEQTQEFEERLRPVRVISVNDDNVFRGRTFSGTSKSSLESRLSFKVTGTVIDLPVQIGQRLNAGDTIAEMDAASYVLQQQQAQASLIEAQANDRRAGANYERTKGLYANDNASLNDLEAARAQAESGEAVVEAATKALEIAKLNVSYTTLAAETDCSINSLAVEINENVSAGQTIAVVSCGDAYEVTMNLPESLIGSVDQWTPVTIEFGAIPDQTFQGEVSEVALASAGAAAFPVVIRIQGSHPSLRSGLAADVTFQFDTSDGPEGTVVLPVNTVINDPAGTYVFVAEPDGDTGEAVIERRAVTLGELTQDGIEVQDGLVAGDRVVTAGITVLRAGQRVLLPRS
ncbi:MAG: efflux RND transporter periplasmic adaptor subunit [Pseudomonadota bacterium]